MKSGLMLILSIVLSVLISVLVMKHAAPTTGEVGRAESVYDRVMRSGIIRCGYLPSPLYLEVDPNTKQISGLIYDYMEQLAKNLHLKVEWAEEIGRGDFIAALEADRLDAYCTTVSINAERARRINYINPQVIDFFNLYVRQDDTRFDDNIESINNSKVRIVAKEGDVYGKIARRVFPEAHLIEIPQLSPDTDVMLDLDTGKADVVISTALVMDQYARNNPGKIRKVKKEGAFVLAYEAIPIKAGDYQFERMLSLASAEMQANGQMQAIYQKYDPEHKLFMRPARAYDVLSK